MSVKQRSVRAVLPTWDIRVCRPPLQQRVLQHVVSSRDARRVTSSTYPVRSFIFSSYDLFLFESPRRFMNNSRVTAGFFPSRPLATAATGKYGKIRKALDASPHQRRRLQARYSFAQISVPAGTAVDVQHDYEAHAYTSMPTNKKEPTTLRGGNIRTAWS